MRTAGPMAFDQETRDLIEQSVLCWLATANEVGEPSVSPKELWGVSGPDCLVIAEIASPNSLANIKKQPRVCVSFIEIFKQKGRKLYGEAAILSPDNPDFHRLGADVIARAGERFVVRHLIHLRVDRVATIVAPSYRLFSDTDEAKMAEEAHATYGVMPRP